MYNARQNFPGKIKKKEEKKAGDVETSTKKRKLHFTPLRAHKIKLVGKLKENIFTSNVSSNELNSVRKYCFDGY